MSYKSILEQTLDRLEPCEQTLRLGWPEHHELIGTCYPLAVAIAEKLFDGDAPILPVFVSATAPYGKLIGLCHKADLCETGARASRIWLKDRSVREGEWPLTLLHEMLHASLSWRGLKTDHNADPWCQEIERMSGILGCPISAKPVRPKRTGKRVARCVMPGHLTRKELARWPHTVPAITSTRLLEFAGFPKTESVTPSYELQTPDPIK
jgi:hypothetical protein